ncbi:MAG: hypothetical protein MHM6MM_004335, partial [Cercozoa sp. M6MM]
MPLLAVVYTLGALFSDVASSSAVTPERATSPLALRLSDLSLRALDSHNHNSLREAEQAEATQASSGEQDVSVYVHDPYSLPPLPQDPPQTADSAGGQQQHMHLPCVGYPLYVPENLPFGCMQWQQQYHHTSQDGQYNYQQLQPPVSARDRRELRTDVIIVLPEYAVLMNALSTEALVFVEYDTAVPRLQPDDLLVRYKVCENSVLLVQLGDTTQLDAHTVMALCNLEHSAVQQGVTAVFQTETSTWTLRDHTLSRVLHESEVARNELDQTKQQLAEERQAMQLARTEHAVAVTQLSDELKKSETSLEVAKTEATRISTLLSQEKSKAETVRSRLQHKVDDAIARVKLTEAEVAEKAKLLAQEKQQTQLAQRELKDSEAATAKLRRELKSARASGDQLTSRVAELDQNFVARWKKAEEQRERQKTALDKVRTENSELKTKLKLFEGKASQTVAIQTDTTQTESESKRSVPRFIQEWSAREPRFPLSYNYALCQLRQVPPVVVSHQDGMLSPNLPCDRLPLFDLGTVSPSLLGDNIDNPVEVVTESDVIDQTRLCLRLVPLDSSLDEVYLMSVRPEARPEEISAVTQAQKLIRKDRQTQNHRLSELQAVQRAMRLFGDEIVITRYTNTRDDSESVDRVFLRGFTGSLPLAIEKHEEHPGFVLPVSDHTAKHGHEDYVCHGLTQHAGLFLFLRSALGQVGDMVNFGLHPYLLDRVAGDTDINTYHRTPLEAELDADDDE